MEIADVRARFTPAVQEIIDLCRITDDFVDKEMFRVYVATIWGNAVLEPDRSGVTEGDLPVLHDFLNEEIEKVLGDGESVTSCYQYIVSQQGEDALIRLQIGAQHKEFLNYFARLVLAQVTD